MPKTHIRGLLVMRICAANATMSELDDHLIALQRISVCGGLDNAAVWAPSEDCEVVAHGVVNRAILGHGLRSSGAAISNVQSCLDSRVMSRMMHVILHLCWRQRLRMTKKAHAI